MILLKNTVLIHCELYEMFLGPLEQHKPWSTHGISGSHNFLRKLWRLFHGADNQLNISSAAATKEELKVLHKTIKKVEEDIERFSFNTSVSTFMICVNELSDLKCNKREILAPLCIILSPYVPHIAEMLWAKLKYGNDFSVTNIPAQESIVFAQFPQWNEDFIKDNDFDYPVSINGKTRFKLNLPLAFGKEEIEKEVMASEELQKWLSGAAPKKVIIVPGRIVNIVS